MNIKVNFLIVVIVGFSTIAIAQRVTVQLQPPAKTEVTYHTNGASIFLNKADIATTFDDFQKTSRFRSYPSGQQLEFMNAVRWMNIQNEVILGNQELHGDARALIQLLDRYVATQLLQKGKAKIVNSKNEDVRTIEYENDNSRTAFFLSRSVIPFFTGGEEPEVEEVVVSFDEPVEIKTDDEEDIVFTVVEQAPTYPGGMDKLNEYIKANLHYPSKSKKDRVEGSVFVAFVVRKDGSLTDLNVIKGLDTACNEEALNLIRKSGKWVPGKQNGKVVNVKFVYPVRFKLESK